MKSNILTAKYSWASNEWSCLWIYQYLKGSCVAFRQISQFAKNKYNSLSLTSWRLHNILKLFTEKLSSNLGYDYKGV